MLKIGLPRELNSVPVTLMVKERADPCKLSSALHTRGMTHVRTHTGLASLTPNKLEASERREAHLRKCLSKIQL